MPWLVPSLQRRWFRSWRPSAWRKAINLRKRWCYLLCAVETERNYHWRTVSNAIGAFELSKERKTTTFRKIGQDILGNAEMEGLIPPVVLYRPCSFRLPFFSIDGTRPGSLELPLFWRSQKIDKFVDRLKIRIIFSRCKRVVASDWQYFES